MNIIKIQFNYNRVKFSGLVSGSYQIDLFEDTVEQIELLKQIDRIRKRFGSSAIGRACGL